MSARNWTPGPWDYVEGRTLLHVETQIDNPAGAGIPVCSVPKSKRANARLIAAAPALYDALAATPCTCTTVAGASHGGQTEQLLDQECGRCAALRLAEGDEA